MIEINKDLHVLVIDDQEPSRVLSRFSLMDLGFKRIGEAEDGQEAMKYVAEAYRQGDPVQLILCDHDMPEVKGFQLFRVFQQTEECKDVPFLMVTSHSEPEFVAEMAVWGVKDFILKPITPALLGAKLVKMLMRK